MSEDRPQFRLRSLFIWIAVIAVICGGLVGYFRSLRHAQISAQVSAYGGRRYTRQEAEAQAGGSLSHIPDAEFRESSN